MQAIKQLSCSLELVLQQECLTTHVTCHLAPVVHCCPVGQRDMGIWHHGDSAYAICVNHKLYPLGLISLLDGSMKICCLWTVWPLNSNHLERRRTLYLFCLTLHVKYLAYSKCSISMCWILKITENNDKYVFKDMYQIHYSRSLVGRNGEIKDKIWFKIK